MEVRCYRPTPVPLTFLHNQLFFKVKHGIHSDAVLGIRIYTILFFECPLYNQIRRNLFLILQIYEDISLEVRLCGKYNLRTE